VSKDKSKQSEAESKKTIKVDPRKAAKFFEHAQTVADARNYDYAIECYVNGLTHDPDNLAKHEALRDVAIRRKATGGKAAPLKERLFASGKSQLEKMLHAEKLWSMEPLNVKHMLTVMKHAADANDEVDNVSLGEVAYWIGSIALEVNTQQKRDKSTYLKLRDYFAQIGAYDKAVEACRFALQLDPGNGDLITSLKNLEAERTMMQGGYTSSDKESGFRQSVRDQDKQTALEQDDRVSTSESGMQDIIERRQHEYDDDPEDMDKLSKLVDALLRYPNGETEKRAIELLEKAHEQSGEYRYHVRIGDVRMKQFSRIIRQLREAIQKQPTDESLKQKLELAQVKRLKFELQEYRDRVSHYPTDLALKFELGKRLFQAKQIDDAIGMFQEATRDARSRAQAHMFLGSCFLAKQWYDEAISTLGEGIESHKIDDDRLALELRYLKMDALEHAARKGKSKDLAQQAREMASEVIQTDINFRDIKSRLDTLRGLVDEMQEA